MPDITTTGVPDPTTGNINLQSGGVVESAVSTQISNINTNISNPLTITGTDGTQIPYTGDGKTASTNAPAAPSNSINFTINNTQRTVDIIRNNVLNNYIDVTYNISIGLVSQSTAQTIMAGNFSDNTPPSQYVIFASTADAKTNTTSAQSGVSFTGDYYNIQSLSFTNIVGLSPQNPVTAIFWDGVMRIYEPYGLQFREDIQIIANSLGYSPQISTSGFVYRMEIWFSGWDPVTGAWTSNIGIPNPQPNATANKNYSIIYYFVITEIKAVVGPNGTIYDLSMQMLGHYATRPETIMFHHETIAKGGVSIDGNANQTFQSFLQALANKLSAQVYLDTNKKIWIDYQFVGLKVLMESTFNQTVKVNFSSGVSQDTSDGSYAVSADNMDLFTLIFNVMINLTLVRQLLVRQDDPTFVQPTILWNIRVNITEATKPDNDMNSYTQYTFQYIFEPVISYRSRMSTIPNRNSTVTPQVQQKRGQKILDYGMLIRWYDYYFTSDNSEIIDFQFVLKNFYYMQIPYDGNEGNEVGQSAHSPDYATLAEKGQTQPNQAAVSQNSTITITPQNVAANGLTFNQLAGVAASPQGSSDTISSAEKIQNRHRGSIQHVPNDNYSQGDAADTNFVNAARDDYYRYDMLSAKVTVRGDPQWLLNPYMEGNDSSAKIPLSETTANTDINANMDRVIFIRAYAPYQKSFMNSQDPTNTLFNKGSSPILSGLYQVNTAVSTFEGGKFTQQLNLYKYPHLNYLVAILNSLGSGEISTSSNNTSTSNSSTNGPDTTIVNSPITSVNCVHRTPNSAPDWKAVRSNLLVQ